VNIKIHEPSSLYYKVRRVGVIATYFAIIFGAAMLAILNHRAYYLISLEIMMTMCAIIALISNYMNKILWEIYCLSGLIVAFIIYMFFAMNLPEFFWIEAVDFFIIIMYLITCWFFLYKSLENKEKINEIILIEKEKGDE